jgi:hypothetical protein
MNFTLGDALQPFYRIEPPRIVSCSSTRPKNDSLTRKGLILKTLAEEDFEFQQRLVMA